jgi:hypothetical protein
MFVCSGVAASHGPLDLKWQSESEKRDVVVAFRGESDTVKGQSALGLAEERFKLSDD